MLLETKHNISVMELKDVLKQTRSSVQISLKKAKEENGLKIIAMIFVRTKKNVNHSKSALIVKNAFYIKNVPSPTYLRVRINNTILKSNLLMKQTNAHGKRLIMRIL